MKRSALQMLLGGSLILGISGCGGVTEEAKVSTALQTLMVLSVEAAITYNIGTVGNGEAIDCGGVGDGTYRPTTSLQNIINFLNGTSNGVAGGQFEFSNCKLNLCGDTITLNGKVDFGISAAETSGERKLTLNIKSNSTSQLIADGIISDAEPDFDYDMSVTASSKSLKDISITGATKPYQYKGKVYKPTEINNLARGC